MTDSRRQRVRGVIGQLVRALQTVPLQYSVIGQRIMIHHGVAKEDITTCDWAGGKCPGESNLATGAREEASKHTDISTTRPSIFLKQQVQLVN